eukprot:6197091-Pleurochrysis_carterae.AAC.1
MNGQKLANSLATANKVKRCSVLFVTQRVPSLKKDSYDPHAQLTLTEPLNRVHPFVPIAFPCVFTIVCEARQSATAFRKILCACVCHPVRLCTS